MSKGKKKPGQRQGPGRKRQQRRGAKREETPEEGPIDMAFEVRKAYAQMRRNRAQIEAGETYASGRYRGREQSPGRTDGASYG